MNYMKICLTFDIEPDLHTLKYKGITKGIERIIKLLDKHSIKGTFFVTCDCIEKYPQIFQNLYKKGHEIALHGYRHVRFDDLSFNEKQEHIKKAINCFKRYLGFFPKGFRSPQYSIDDTTLEIISKNNFEYDSSYAPLNLLQFLFFLKRFKTWIKQFFSPIQKYKIKKNLIEIPTTSFVFPFSSLVLRIFPRSVFNIYFFFLKLFYKEMVFIAHSWDFINMPKSKIATKWPKEILIKNMKWFLKNPKCNFIKCNEL